MRGLWIGFAPGLGKCFLPVRLSRLTAAASASTVFGTTMSASHQPSPLPAPPGEKIPGTIAEHARHSTAENMTAKTQEATLDRLLVDRFKNGDAAAFNE